MAALAADLGVVRTYNGFAAPMVTTATAALLLGLATAGSPLAGGDITLSMEIASRDGTRRVSVGPSGRHFHVTLRNTGGTPQRIWDDTFSWGYYALSFEVIGSDGTAGMIRKRETVFTRNMPASWTIEPGAAFVVDVYLGDRKRWEGVPSVGSNCKPFRLRAIYAVAPDEESGKLGVWTGRLASATENVELCP